MSSFLYKKIWHGISIHTRKCIPFKVQLFRLMTLIGIAAFMVLLGTEQMVSIFAQDVTHLTSMQAGMVLLSWCRIKCNHGGNCWPFI